MDKPAETRERVAFGIAEGQQRAVRLRDRALASVGRLSEAASFARARALAARRGGAEEKAAQQERRACFLEAAAGRYETAVDRIDDQIRRHNHTLPGALDLGPTPDRMVKRLLPDGITRLVQAGALDFAQLRAAHEIARIYEASTIAVRAATMMPATAVRARRQAPVDPMSDDTAERRRTRYLPWVRSMQGRADIDLALVLDVVVHGLSLEAVRKARHVGWRRARDMVVEALDAYARLQKERR